MSNAVAQLVRRFTYWAKCEFNPRHRKQEEGVEEIELMHLAFRAIGKALKVKEVGYDIKAIRGGKLLFGINHHRIYFTLETVRGVLHQGGYGQLKRWARHKVLLAKMCEPAKDPILDWAFQWEAGGPGPTVKQMDDYESTLWKKE